MKKVLFIFPSSTEPEKIKLNYLDKLSEKVEWYKAEINVKKALQIKEHYTNTVVPFILNNKIDYLIVCSSEYFKVIAKITKTNRYIGYIFNKKENNYSFNILYLPFYKSIFYDPESFSKIDIVLKTINRHLKGVYREPGVDILSPVTDPSIIRYPKNAKEIESQLKLLYKHPALTIDIETYSLKHPTSGLGSITFCWNEREGIAFRIDPERGKINTEVRELLKNFFINYTGKCIYHNIAFDAYILIFQLFMTDLLDYKGLLYGLEVMLKNWDDTKLITYLCTNSCTGNYLSLKDQAQEFAGNYAKEDINDISKIPEEELLEYNLIDGLSTWFVYNKHIDTLDKDNQRHIYETIFKPATKDIIQMQLTGMPLDYERVLEVDKELQQDQDNALNIINNNKHIKAFTFILNEEWVEKRNSKLKVKKVSLEDAHEQFNPNSSKQLQQLFYNFLKLPVLSTTKTKLPTTDGDTIKALIHHTDDPDTKELLQALVDYGAVNKILSDFIPAFKNAYRASDGRAYLFGNYNLGGTVSGRLSSSKVNLQNLPATGSKYAKIIKSCFKAPPGYLFVGLDYHSLEDYISALTTKDPNKLKIYIDGYDSHSYRSYFYFREKFPDISLAEPEEECYKCVINGEVQYIHEKELINYQGKQILGKNLYNLICKDN